MYFDAYKKVTIGLGKPFSLSDDINSQQEAMAIYLASQRQHPVMHNSGDKVDQVNSPMSKTHFALRPEALDHRESPTLRNYQETLKNMTQVSSSRQFIAGIIWKSFVIVSIWFLTC